jgi:hypothetical protein
MIVVRDIFQIKFGRMKEALESWKEMAGAGDVYHKRFVPLVDSGRREIFTVAE